MMSPNFKVEVIHKEIITPSFPTPPHLKTLQLSFLDQFFPEDCTPLLFFYPNHADNQVDADHQSLITEKTSILKASLSENLTQFYPLAGKLRCNDSVLCDDHGAAFIEAKVNCQILELLENPDVERLKCLLPAAVEGHLLLVQVNFFECGGMAIAIGISHKVADAFTFCTFMRSWSAVARGSSSKSDHPVLRAEFGVAASLYPPQDFLNSPKHLAESNPKKCTTRRFVFHASQIVALKFKAASASVPSPRRVEVVSALIWKCAMEASRSNLGSVRPSLWLQSVNMRKRSGQAFTENILGNFLWRFEVITVESALDLQSLVAALRKGMEDYKVNYPNGVIAEDIYKRIKEPGKSFGNEGDYGCSSVCGIPFYESNFGWGKPSWVSAACIQYENAVFLMDTKDGNGIEVSLTLSEEDMAIFESNQELLAYASLNPAVEIYKSEEGAWHRSAL